MAIGKPSIKPEIVKACIAGGYTSVMIDGSNLP